MTLKARLRTLEKKTLPKKPVLMVWCEPEESEEKAWTKAYGDIPKPEDRDIMFIHWLS